MAYAVPLKQYMPKVLTKQLILPVCGSRNAFSLSSLPSFSTPLTNIEPGVIEGSAGFPCTRTLSLGPTGLLPRYRPEIFDEEDGFE